MTHPPYDIIGLGVSTVDLSMLVDDFLGAEGVRQALAVETQGGGSVATALAAASVLGSKTAMIDCFGDDWRGDFILNAFHRYGVETGYIQIVPGESAAISSIQVRQRDGARAITFSPASAGEAAFAALPEQAVRTAKIVHMNGRHPKACGLICQWAKESGVKLSFDGGAGRFRPELLPFLQACGIVIVSQDFATQWLGAAEPEKLCVSILAQGADIAVVTAGEKGCTVQGKGQSAFHQKAYPVTAVDTTGCGDIFHGAFLHVVASEGSLQRAAQLASAAAALKAQHRGGRGLVPTMGEIEDFLAAHGEALR